MGHCAPAVRGDVPLSPVYLFLGTGPSSRRDSRKVPAKLLKCHFSLWTWVMSLEPAEVEQALLAPDQSDRAAVIRRALQSLEADELDVSQVNVEKPSVKNQCAESRSEPNETTAWYKPC